MVAGMIRWPWPTIMLWKFEVKLMVRGIKGLTLDSPTEEFPESSGMMIAEVRWKGPKTTALRSLRRTVKRNCTKVEAVKGDQGEVEWNEEFGSVVGLTADKENAFNLWEIEIVVFYGLKQVSKNKASVIGTASFNIAEYASASGEELELNLPLSSASFDTDSRPTLSLTLKLLLRTCPESPETAQRPVIPSPSSPPTGITPSEKDELSALKAGLRKVKILTEFVSARRSKKSYHEYEGSDGRCSAGSEDVDYLYPLDTDSLDDNPRVELEDGKDETSIRKSFSYGSLANANYIDGVFFSDIGKHEDLVYYSHRRSDVGCSLGEVATSSVHEESILHSKRSILPWKKRKYNFRSPKAKGEPLLKKAYGEEGGDDIDYDRRQLSSSDESLFQLRHKADDDGSSAHSSSVSDFGDDNFAIGTWESQEVISRDGRMKLSVEVFFASIDQRNERVAGQSACTALVAVIAEWFKLNRGMMPIKSQFDCLIREGSTEWRDLCGNQTYIEQFPDKHFDLETILEAKISRLSVAPEKSYIGFFYPIGCEDNSGFDFLQGAMTFDSIWDEISSSESDCLYIVSWNDHFFVLKVERDAYYIIDTLGERLYEGCDRAYMLKFDRSTTIRRTQNQKENKTNSKEGGYGEEGKQAIAAKEEIVCRGKESCKEYIKSFLAAIPIRELQADMKKGLMPSTPLHHRLQIEFHYAEVANDRYNSLAIPARSFRESTSQVSWPQGSLLVTGPTLTPAAVVVVV